MGISDLDNIPPISFLDRVSLNGLVRVDITKKKRLIFAGAFEFVD